MPLVVIGPGPGVEQPQVRLVELASSSLKPTSQAADSAGGELGPAQARATRRIEISVIGLLAPEQEL